MYGAIINSMIIIISAFEYGGGEPAAIFPFTTAAESYMIPGIYRNPLSVTGGNGYTISLYASRPYSEEALHSCTSGVKYSKETWGVQIAGHSFGADFYRENRFSASAGLSFFKMLNTGFSVSAYTIGIETDDEHIRSTMYDGDISASVTPFRGLTFAVTQGSVSSVFNNKNRLELYPERSAGVVIKPSQGFNLSWNLTDTSAGFINSFTAGITPAPFLHLSGGYTPEDSRFAASLTVLLKKLNVSYSLSSHPYLGYTHSLGLTISPDTDIESVSLRNSNTSAPDKKININSATDEEIKRIPGISSLSAERIILYRTKIGPVSEKALRQVGLDSDEITAVKQNCYGMVRDLNKKPEEKSAKKTANKSIKYIPPKEKIKIRFRAMIQEGVPASAAIRYSELAESHRRSELSLRLEEDTTLTEQQKEIIRRNCSR